MQLQVHQRFHHCSKPKEIKAIMLKMFKIQLDEDNLREQIIMKTLSMM